MRTVMVTVVRATWGRLARTRARAHATMPACMRTYAHTQACTRARRLCKAGGRQAQGMLATSAQRIRREFKQWDYLLFLQIRSYDNVSQRCLSAHEHTEVSFKLIGSSNRALNSSFKCYAHFC